MNYLSEFLNIYNTLSKLNEEAIVSVEDPTRAFNRPMINGSNIANSTSTKLVKNLETDLYSLPDGIKKCFYPKRLETCHLEDVQCIHIPELIRIYSGYSNDIKTEIKSKIEEILKNQFSGNTWTPMGTSAQKAKSVQYLHNAFQQEIAMLKITNLARNPQATHTEVTGVTKDAKYQCLVNRGINSNPDFIYTYSGNTYFVEAKMTNKILGNKIKVPNSHDTPIILYCVQSGLGAQDKLSPIDVEWKLYLLNFSEPAEYKTENTTDPITGETRIQKIAYRQYIIANTEEAKSSSHVSKLLAEIINLPKTLDLIKL